MVNVRSIAVEKFQAIGFKTKMEGLTFIKEEKIKSNKNQNENDLINILMMKRQQKINNTIKKIISNIKENIDKNDDITINENMSQKTAKSIITQVNRSDKKLLFTLQYDNDVIRSYVNDRGSLYENNRTPYGSDEQEEIEKHNIKSINVKEFFRSSNRKSIGAFFNYYNTTEIDLSRYGIYHNKDESDYEDNCIIHSLIETKLFSEEQINSIKMHCKRRDTSIKTLHSISDEFNVNFNINKFYENKVVKENVQKIKSVKSSPETKTIDIALYDNHWFLYEDVKATKYFINNYNEIKEYVIKNSLDILDYTTTTKFCKIANKYISRKDRGSVINSLSLINFMYKNNLFKRISMEDVMEIKYFDNFKNDKITLPKEISESNYRIKVNPSDNNNSTNKKKYEYITFADFEATTMKNYIKNADKHTSFMISFKTIDYNKLLLIDEDTFIRKPEISLAIQFLDRLKHNSLIYFHNLKYDKNFIFDNLQIINYLEKDGQLYEISALYKGKLLYFRDSYKLIAEPLKKFSSMFGLDVKKEIFPYNFYNEKNIEEILKGSLFSINTVIKNCFENVNEVSENDKEESENKIKEFNDCINMLKKSNKNVKNTKSKFNALEYAKFYCEQDVEVLYKGMMVFRDLVLEALKIDIFDNLTISSVAEKYLINQGCYNDVMEISGVVQLFINKSVFGGRVMISKNEPKEVITNIQDLDACSLYPTAMSKIKGFAIGKPTTIDITNFDINNNNLYYIEIELLDEYYTRGKGNRILTNSDRILSNSEDLNLIRYEFDYDFPLWGVRDKDDVIEYVNFPSTRNFVVNNDILADLIKFYKLEINKHYKIIQGVIFNDGYNDKINNVMRFLYNERTKQKKLDNKIEKIYKLIMNSAYGKTLTKYNDTRIKIFNTDKKETIESFIYNNYNNIKEVLYTNKHTIIKLYNEYGKHWNACHIGSAVLAKSKVIMNNIFYICHHKGLTPLYQDTDSIHIPEDQIKHLPSDIIGENMGEFHCDFDKEQFKYVNKNIKIENNLAPIYSIKSIFIGKKTYIDCLRHRQSNEEYFHFRFKGVNQDVVKRTAREMGLTVYELYQKMLNNETIDFNDSYSTKAKFQQIDLCNIRNRENSIKKIKIKK